MNLGTLGLLFLLTLFLQQVQDRSPDEAGLAVLPALVPVALLPPLVGRWVARSGPAPVVATGLALAGVGTGLVSTWQPGTPYGWLVPALLLWGCGLGLLAPAIVTAAVSAAPAHRSGLASGVNNTARQTGGALGIAAYGALAGAPARAGHFLSGLHAARLATCALYAVAAMASLRWLAPLRPTSAASR
jgi:DHA2 family methylenomycin A resistance protein-like MFS transporter